MRPEGVSIRILGAKSLEAESNKVQQDLRIFVRDDEAIDNISSLIQGRGDGKVSFVVVKNFGESEIEVQLKNKINVTNRMKSALIAVPGVLDVELV